MGIVRGFKEFVYKAYQDARGVSAKTRPCPECASTISVAAKRCPNCTQPVLPDAV